MIYQDSGRILTELRCVFHGEANDVVICQDTAAPAAPRYTLLVIRDPECARRLLEVFRAAGPGRDQPYLFRFSVNDRLCLAFPYRPERRLDRFAEGQMPSPAAREAVCVSLVMECLASNLPYPLLYLALDPENLHIGADNQVYFTHYFDLAKLDPRKGEASCCGHCVETLLPLLEGGSRKGLKSFQLLWKKLDRNACQSFSELYRDIRLTAVPIKKPSIRQRIRSAWRRNEDRLFRLLLIVSSAAVITALVILITDALFGESFLFKLFENHFSQIGTERLG